MKIETIVTLGIVGVILYLVYQLAQTFGVTPAGVQSAITSTGNVIENAATGGLSAAQQSDLISQETQSLIMAGATPSAAQVQATADYASVSALPQLTYWDGVKAAFIDI